MDEINKFDLGGVAADDKEAATEEKIKIPPQSKTVQLLFPIEHPKGKALTEITLRRLKVKELKTIKLTHNAGMASLMPYISLMAYIPESVLDELDAADAMKLTTEAASFLGVGDGETLSQ